VHESDSTDALRPCEPLLEVLQEAKQEQDLARRCVAFSSDADSVKALAASAGWLKGVHCKHVTQPGALAEHMLRTPKGGKSQHAHEVEQEHQESLQSKLEHIVSSQAFESASGMLIFINAVMSGVVATESIRRAVAGDSSLLPAPFQVIQITLTFCLLVEWMLRLAAYGTNFFTCRDRVWHAFDTIIVTLSTADVIVGLAVARGASGRSASLSALLRIFRFFRLVRAIRFIRVLRVFQELRYIISSLRKSVALLTWPLVFLSILVYVCSIVISTTVPEQIREAPANRRQHLLKNFGSFLSIMKTLFMTASGGMDWSVAVDSLENGDSTSYLFFLVYIILSKFLLFNLLSGIFVLSVFDQCKSDDQRMLTEQLLTQNSCGAKIRALFQEVDVTGTGSISGDSLEDLLLDPFLIDILNDFDIDTSEVAGVFKLLDVDGSGYVNIDELIITMFRLRTHSQGVDLPSLLHESRKIGCHLMQAVQDNENRVVELKAAMTSMHNLNVQGFKAILDPQKRQGWATC